MIDFEEIISQQKDRTVALGNMGVNGNGDRLGEGGQVVQSNTNRVRSYYRDNPRSSTHYASLKNPLDIGAEPVAAKADVDTDISAIDQRPDIEPELEKDLTVEEILSQAEAQSDAENSAAEANPPTRRKTRRKTTKTETVQETPVEAENEPLGYNEVELPNGDIQMVPYYNEDDQS